MSPSPTNAELLKLCAEELTKEGLVPFTRQDLIARVQKIDPARLEQSLNPTIQGMTINLQGGVGVVRNVFYSVGRGLFVIYNQAKHGNHGPGAEAVKETIMEAPPAIPAPREPLVDPVDVRSLPLANLEVAREFAYKGETGITEDQVKSAVNNVLREQGWSVQVKWGYEQGIDIEAQLGPERLVLEAKGEGSLNPMRVNYFVGALGELMQRMDSECRYGLALPAHRQFVNLALGLPDWVRDRLNLCFYFVRPAGEGVYEVGIMENNRDR